MGRDGTDPLQAGHLLMDSTNWFLDWQLARTRAELVAERAAARHAREREARGGTFASNAMGAFGGGGSSGGGGSGDSW
jgi:uncharacterized membrane protein YgcG